jgi:hypothetical protein
MTAELEDRFKHLEDTAANVPKSPRKKKAVRRQTSVYWCDFRE